MILYSICYYYGKNNKNNIFNHLNTYSKIENNLKKFVIVFMFDFEHLPHLDEIKKELSEIILKYNNEISFEILSCFNWGGTILALWIVYNYGKIYSDDCIIAQFEEDFLPINNKWYEDSVSLLNDNTKNYIYIGEHIPPVNDRYVNNNVKLYEKDEFINIINKFNKSNYTNICKWTDGGFYFSTIKNLQSCEDF